MEIDPLPFHVDKRSAYHHRNAQRQHDPAPKAQRQETGRHDDNDGFQQGFCKFMNGIIHHRRLIRYLLDIQAGRKLRFLFFNFPLQIFPENQIISAGRHRYGNSYRRFSIEIHKRCFRIRIHLCD